MNKIKILMICLLITSSLLVSQDLTVKDGITLDFSCGGATLNYNSITVETGGKLYICNRIVNCSTLIINGYVELDEASLNCSGSATVKGTLQAGNSTLSFNGITINKRLEMQPGTTLNSKSIAIVGVDATFETSGTSSARNNVNISNYGELAVSGFLNGKYTTFTFGTRSQCKITSKLERIYMDEYNHMYWSVKVAGTTYTYNTYNSVFQGNGEKGS